MGMLEDLLGLLEALEWDNIAKVIISILPVEKAFDSMMDTGVNLWGTFFASIGLYSTIAVLALIVLCMIMSVAPPSSIGFIKPYGGLYDASELMKVMPGLKKYFVAPQQKIGTWMINIFAKPPLFIIMTSISMAITSFLLVDRGFISDMLTSLFADPVASVPLISSTLFWATFIIKACSYIMVGGIFSYAVIELGNAFNNRITGWIEEMMYATLVVPPMVAFLYRIAFMMNAQNEPVIGMVMWVAAIVIPVALVVGGFVKAMALIAVDVVVMYALKGLSAKGFLSGLQLDKLFAISTVLKRAGGGVTAGQSPHRTGLPTRLLRV